MGPGEEILRWDIIYISWEFVVCMVPWSNEVPFWASCSLHMFSFLTVDRLAYNCHCISRPPVRFMLLQRSVWERLSKFYLHNSGFPSNFGSVKGSHVSNHLTTIFPGQYPFSIILFLAHQVLGIWAPCFSQALPPFPFFNGFGSQIAVTWWRDISSVTPQLLPSFHHPPLHTTTSKRSRAWRIKIYLFLLPSISFPIIFRVVGLERATLVSPSSFDSFLNTSTPSLPKQAIKKSRIW